MALYHCTTKFITRSKGHSVVAAAAYRGGVCLTGEFVDFETGLAFEKTFDYSNRKDVVFSEIFLPQTASEWMQDRQKLWNHIEKIEKRKDAQLAKEVEVSLQKELTLEQNLEILRSFVKECFTNKGIIADINIHSDDGNPHAHILLTTREILGDGFGNKNREWSTFSFLMSTRKAWANIVNRHFKQYGYDLKIDHRSYKNQGIDLVATIHEGAATKINTHAERIEQNEQIREENAKRIVESPEIIIDVVGAKYTVFSKAEIATEIFNILERSQSYTGEHYFEKVLNGVLGHERLVVATEKSIKDEVLYSTKEKSDVEKSLWNSIETLQNKQGRSGSSLYKKIRFSLPHSLSEEQKGAVEHLTSAQGVSVLLGRAGTGKSRLLKEVTSSYVLNGYEVLGGAVSGIATDNLSGSCSKGTFKTIAGWNLFLQAKANQDYLKSRSVFIIDEASMVDVADLAKLAERISKVGAKLILIGDPDQIQAINVPGGFKAVCDRLGYYSLEKVWRQKEKWQEEATVKIANGDVRKGLNDYDKHGCIEFVETKDQAKNRLVTSYVGDFIAGEKSNVALSYRKDTINYLNCEIRDRLIKAGELIEVKGAKFKAHEGIIDIAKGEQVVFTKNDLKLGVYNGTRAIVKNIDLSNERLQGRITFEIVGEKKTVTIDTSEYNNFSYGYATTIHKSQGLTVNKTYLLAEKYMNFNAFYVSASRHEQDLKIFADKETFENIDDLGRIFERDYKHRGLIDSYDLSVTPERQQYFNTVKEYKAVKEAVAEQYAEMLNTIKENNGYLDEVYMSVSHLVEERTELAQEIEDDLKGHSIYLMQANINKQLVIKHANRDTYDEPAQLDAILEYNQATTQDQKRLFAFELVNNKHLVTSNEFEGLKNVEKNADGFVEASRDILRAAGRLSILEKYASLEVLRGKDKIEMAKNLQADLVAKTSQKRLLDSELKVANSEMLQAQENLSIIRYKEELLEKYLAKTYTKPVDALNEWKSLKEDRGLNSALKMVEEDFTILGNACGREFLKGYLKSSTRKKAIALGITLSSKLKAYEVDGLKKPALGKQVIERSVAADRLKKEVEKITDKLSWIPDNSRVINIIQREASRTGENRADKLARLWEDQIICKKDWDRLSNSKNDMLCEVFKARFENNFELWNKFIVYVVESKFLMGENSDFRVSLGWAIQDKNLDKILDGKYHPIGISFSDFVSRNTKAKDFNFEIETKSLHLEVEKPTSTIIRDYLKFDQDVSFATGKIAEHRKEIDYCKDLISSTEAKLEKIYVNPYKEALENFEKLANEKGLRRSIKMITENHSLIGEIRGNLNLLGFPDKERAVAWKMSHELGSNLKRYLDTAARLPVIESQIEKTKEIAITKSLKVYGFEEKINKLAINNAVFESQYKEYYLNNGTKPDKEALREMENICRKVDSYIDRQPELLNSMTSKQLADSACFEQERYRENSNAFGKESEVSIQYLTKLQLEEYLKDPESKEAATEKGRDLFEEQNRSAVEFANELIKDRKIKDGRDILIEKVKEFAMTHDKLPEGRAISVVLVEVEKSNQEKIFKEGCELGELQAKAEVITNMMKGDVLVSDDIVRVFNLAKDDVVSVAQEVGAILNVRNDIKFTKEDHNFMFEEGIKDGIVKGKSGLVAQMFKNDMKSSISDFIDLPQDKINEIDKTVYNLRRLEKVTTVAESIGKSTEALTVELSNWNVLGNSTELTGLRDNEMKVLTNSIRATKTSLTIDLSYNSITGEGVKYISDAIENSSSPLNLNLSNNYMGVEGARILSNALRERTAPLIIDLSSSEIGAGARHLFKAIGESEADVLRVDLSNNGIDDEEIKFLSESLSKTKASVNIDLSHNDIGDEGAEYLTKAIEERQAPLSINLSENNLISEDMAYALQNAAENAQSLVTVTFENEKVKEIAQESNHEQLDLEIVSIKTKINLANKEIENTKMFQSQLIGKIRDIFVHQPFEAFDQWQKLVDKDGVRKAEIAVNKDPTILGKLQGDTKLFGLVGDKTRKRVEDLSVGLGTDLRSYTKSDSKISEFENKIKDIKQDGVSSNLSHTIVETNILNKTGKKQLHQEIDKGKVRSLIFESQYKEYRLNNDEKPDKEALREMDNICDRVESYINKDSDLLKERTSKDLVVCAEFERKIYKENHKEIELNKIDEKSVLNVSDMLQVNSDAKLLTDFHTQELLKDPSNKREAIEQGQSLFEELKQSSNALSADLIQKQPGLQESQNLLNQNIKDFIVENNRMPDEIEQKLIAMQVTLDTTAIDNLSNRLDQIFDTKLINNEFIKENKLEIATYMLRQDPLSNANPQKDLVQNLEKTMKDVIKEQTNELELQKDLDRGFGLSR